jgi:hypothetical protein
MNRMPGPREVVQVRRLGAYLMPALVALIGLACVAGALLVATGDLLVRIPFLLTGAGIVAWAALVAPPRWNGEPEEKEIEVGGAPVRALVFPMVRRRYVASAVAMSLWTLAGLTGVPLGLLEDQPVLAAIAGVWTAVLAPTTVAAVLRLIRPKYLAMSQDRLHLQVSGNRADVAWHDIEQIDVLPTAGGYFYAIKLLPGVDVPKGGWLKRLDRSLGADLVVQVEWVDCRPEQVLDAFVRHLPSAETGVIG